MKLQKYALLIAILLIILPVVLVLSERKWAQELAEEKFTNGLQREAKTQLKEMQQTNDMGIQLANLFQKFSTAVQQRTLRSGATLSAKRLEWLHKKILVPLLPDHDLLVFSLTSPVRWRSLQEKQISCLYSHSNELGLTPEIGKQTLFRISRGLVASQPFSCPELNKVFHFPLPFLDQGFLFRNKIQLFLGLDGNRGFFWKPFSTTSSSSGQIVVMGLVDLQLLDSLFPLKAIVKTFRKPHSGIGFLHTGGGAALLSSFFDENPELKSRLMSIQMSQAGFPRFERIGNFLFFSIPPAPGSRYQPILVREIRNLPDFNTAQGALILLFFSLLAGGGIILAVERLIFNRGPRLRVGVVLLFGFLLTSFLPITGAGIMARSAMYEEERKMLEDESRSLHQVLSNLDQGFRGFLGNIVQDVLRISQRASNTAALRAEEGLDQPGTAIMNFSNAADKLVVEDPASPGPQPHFLAVSAMGPRGYMPSSIHPEDTTMGNTPSDMQPMAGGGWPTMIAMLQQPLVEQLNAPEFSVPMATIPEGLNVKEVRSEAVNDVLAGMIGADTLLNFVFYHSRVHSFKSVFGLYYFFQLLLPSEGYLRYILTWMWDEMAIVRPYLYRELSARNLYNKQPPDFRIFAKFRHDRLVHSSVPRGLTTYPSLARLSETVHHTDQFMQIQETSASGPVLMESFPGRCMTKVVLSGRKVLTNLIPSQERRWQMFFLVMGAVLGITLLAVWMATRHISLPIGVILGGIRKIDEEDYETRLHFPDRRDEFQKLAATFNAMAQGLQEGRILSRYVSTTVQRAIQDVGFRQRASVGENAEVTILFSSLAGFSDFQAHHTPEEVFTILETHLEIVSTALSLFGGEIDKVMGEKILVVFHHRDFASGKQAVQAALNVVTTIRSEIRRQCPLPPAMGLNFGQVIAGILGAPTVRLDFTVIGDPVNLAARLASLAQETGEDQVFLSGTLIPILPEGTRIERLSLTRVKGKTQEVEAHRLL